MTEGLKARATRLGYTGKLLSPPLPPANDSDSTSWSSPDLPDAYANEIIERVELLMEHYGIAGAEPHDFVQLIVRLANDWVPGFGAADGSIPPRRPGRPAKRMKKFYDFELFTSIERLKYEDPKRNLGAACRVFLKRNANHERWSSVSPASLENNYRRIAKKLGTGTTYLRSHATTSADFTTLIEGVKNAYADRYSVR